MPKPPCGKRFEKLGSRWVCKRPTGHTGVHSGNAGKQLKTKTHFRQDITNPKRKVRVNSRTGHTEYLKKKYP